MYCQIKFTQGTCLDLKTNVTVIIADDAACNFICTVVDYDIQGEELKNKYDRKICVSGL